METNNNITDHPMIRQILSMFRVYQIYKIDQFLQQKGYKIEYIDEIYSRFLSLIILYFLIFLLNYSYKINVF